MFFLFEKSHPLSSSTIVSLKYKKSNLCKLWSKGKDVSLYNSKKYWDYNLNSNDLDVESIQTIFKRCEEFLSYISEKYKMIYYTCL